MAENDVSESKQVVILTYQFNNGLFREKEFVSDITMNKALSMLLKDIDEKGYKRYIYYSI